MRGLGGTIEVQATPGRGTTVKVWLPVESATADGRLGAAAGGRELLLVWVRVRDLLPALRVKNHDTRTLVNLETVALEFIAWWEQQTPGDFEAFANRVRG